MVRSGCGVSRGRVADDSFAAASWHPQESTVRRRWRSAACARADHSFFSPCADRHRCHQQPLPLLADVVKQSIRRTAINRSSSLPLFPITRTPPFGTPFLLLLSMLPLSMSYRPSLIATLLLLPPSRASTVPLAHPLPLPLNLVPPFALPHFSVRYDKESKAKNFSNVNAWTRNEEGRDKQTKDPARALAESLCALPFCSPRTSSPPYTSALMFGPAHWETTRDAKLQVPPQRTPGSNER